ncbi:bifunctional serine/threonine-protein kinase/formylglycine-generating enzyme family protein [Hyalangium rubrum]|uniref:Protein kinase n=1 Tax=Hyalangium rubrum TaxID=3103134 RepID=A0ABU5HG40_9BACT|nr:protein kinase [Hyalangium sp. s54d21]MDY7231777.1 protein kinase [Hyalangium sp. s54d21]
MPPLEFDEFRVEREIGRGGMGVIYLAQDTSLGRPVAVKFIALQQPESLVRAYIETEARAIARLQHPNVVTVYRVGKVEEHPYIVSEYVVGQSLSELSLPLPWRRVLTLGLGLARGLAAAHHQGVLHRDIKPANALLAASGEVKLLDFGLAERFDPSGASSPVGTANLAGTPAYMAPEIRRGAPPTPQSDLYSLGLTLYELCTGKLPPAVGGLDRRHDASAIELVPGIDPDFAKLILRCLSHSPIQRLATADILREGLEHLEHLHSAPLLAASNPYRGLAPFEAEHQKLFFGRDADIRAVLERLHRQPLVLVAGDSGAGKSSLCRAGVLPWARSDALNEGRDISTVTLWPGHRPLQALAAALAPLLGQKEAELVTVLLTDLPAWLGQTLRERYHGKRGLLLFIDQLEEILTQAAPSEATRFAAILGGLALPSSGVRVLLAVRGDFLTRICALPGLGEEAERALYILRPMSPEGTREAIVDPARTRGVVFESDELIQTLVASTAHGAGSLPLLQFALAELWERRDSARGCITLESLGEMGGVAGALSRHADGVIQRLSPTEQQAARRILLQLVTADGTRSNRSEEELVSARDPASGAALRALLEGRILHAHTAGGQARYELAHDSLLMSWGTLRNWVDDDIGHRAVRQRVEQASTEWERLERARDVLWAQRQLDEARPLDPKTLSPQARAFLFTSRRALRLQRWGRYLSVTLLVLALAATYGGLRLHASFEDKRFVTAELGKARQLLGEGHALAEKARTTREEALTLFGGRGALSSNPGTPQSAPDLWNSAERRWTEALALFERADAAYASAGQPLERALERQYGHEEARQLRLEVAYERLLLAEDFHQKRLRTELQRSLERLTDHPKEGAEWRQRLFAPAELELVIDPPGARVEFQRYISDDQRVRHLEPAPDLGQMPLPRLQLPPGSYLLHITHPYRPPLDLPLLVTRGARETLRLTLPTAPPPGYAYIPPGCFLSGSAEPEEVRRFMQSPPLHPTCLTEGYVIGKTEVTFGNWLEYLNTLPPNARARHILAKPIFSSAGAVTLQHQPGVGWLFSFYRSSTDIFTARVGEPLHYPGRSRRNTADWRQFPLSGVSAEHLAGYFYWLDHTGRLPGARLCSEHEWERAARGADGRGYPHGDVLMLDDANIDETYQRQHLAFGPDEVGSHPASTSPFGLADMAGNAYELTRSVTSDLGRIVLRGGAWYYNSATARAANREAGDPTQSSVTVGVRVCASYAAR